jgi:BirA family biotin operon repressor/biotin-[acetyl-CoA-carboxylase] ligase
MSIGSWSYEWAKQQQLNSDWLEQTQSTQFWAKQMLEFKIPEHVNYSLRQENKKYVGAFEKVYFTDTQTAGRGQGTNSWTNPDIGTSLLSTWVFDLNISPPPFITLKVGLALIRACTTTWPQLRWSLKAQNDLLLQDKKVAGLLLETISQGSSYKLLIGLGFNIHNKPNNLA